MPDYPGSVLAAAESAVNDIYARRGWNKPAPWFVKEVSAAALDAAAPLLERSIRRRMAREILFLDQMDQKLTRNKGPYGDMRTSLRRLERGEALPGVRELRGGERADHD